MKHPSRSLLGIGILFFAGCIAAFHLISAWKGYPGYRDIHLGTAIQYAKNGIDLMHPVIVGFNATGTPTAQEIPVWQATAGWLLGAFGMWLGWANVASLLLFLPALYPLFQLAREAYGERVARWSLVVFLAEPLIFEQAGRAGTDGSCLTFALWFLFTATRCLRQPGWAWMTIAALLGALAAVSKLPFFMAYGIAAFLICLGEKGWAWRPLARLAVIGMFGAVIFMFWTRHTDALQDHAVFPLVDLRVSKNPDMVWWYFGDMAYRLNPANWIRGIWRFLNAEFGSFVLVVLAAWGLFLKRKGAAGAILTGGVLTTLVFTHLILHHQNYFLIFSPAVAMLGALGISKIEDLLSADHPGKKRLLFETCVITALALSLLQGVIGMKMVLQFDPYPEQVVSLIRSNTRPDEKLLIQGGGWGGDLLFRSDRTGLSIWETGFLDQGENLARLKALGFTKLVMVSESPFLTALQQVNPGCASQKRQTYSKSLVGKAKGWPVVLENEDLVIKEIP